MKPGFDMLIVAIAVAFGLWSWSRDRRELEQRRRSDRARNNLGRSLT